MPATEPIVIVGAGGHGREVHDVLLADGRFQLEGFLDDGSPDLERLKRRGAEHLGGTDRLGELGRRYVIGIGNPSARRRIDEQAVSLGLEPVTLVHPSATRGLHVELGPGTVVCAHVSLTTNIRCGRHVHLNVSATIAHDAVLGDFVTVSPGANISGEVRLDDEVTIGTGSTVNQGLTVGRGTTVGAGAAVVGDLPAGVVAVGVPARPRS